MDYEQWKPLGRGDPLKNDPTYDYVPPVLERVHYWIDPALRKPDPEITGENNNRQKTEILVLGVTSKKPSGAPSFADRRDNYDPFLKFVEGPKFSRPHYTLPASYYPSPFYSNKNKLPERPGFSSKGEQRVPYTMLVPPPVHKKSESAQFQKPHDVTPIATTLSTVVPFRHSTPGVVVQQSNLVYQSSSLSHHQWKDKNHHHFATQAESSSHVTWKTPTPNKTRDDGENVSVKNEMNFVTMPPVVNHVMHKGEVTDDTMDIASTYVNIGKPEAQVHPPTGVDISTVQIPSPNMPIRQPPVIMNINPAPHLMLGNPHVHKMPPMHSMETMQTMQPPPVSMPMESTFGNIMSAVQTLLQKEVTPSESYPATNNIDEYTASEIRLTPTAVPATTSPTTTTTTAKLTTDPLFKHYKQPEAPLRGPMYLIIQGHSKVKTYGPSKQMNGIPVQETNEVLTADEYSNVKHLHSYKKEVGEERQRESRSGDLQTLTHVVQTGLGAINIDMGENRRKDGDVQETELEVKYDVGSRREATSEKYYKGIVETGNVARKLETAAEH